MSKTETASSKRNAMPWGLQLRELRLAAGLTQPVLAERIGTTKATISKMERAIKPPKMDWIEKLADALDVSIATLALGIDFAVEAERPSLVPVIGMIAAGNWREAIQSPEGHIAVMNAKPHMFALKVSGDSIDRVAPEGSFVAIDPSNPSLSDGLVYAVQNAEGETTLKRFRRGPDRLEPDSTNPVHKPILLGGEAITIIGRAIQVIHLL